MTRRSVVCYNAVMDKAQRKEQQRREQALNRARKLCPGRDGIEDLRAIGLLFEAQGDEDAVKLLERAVECLEHLRVAAHGGPIDRPMPGRGGPSKWA